MAPSGRAAWREAPRLQPTSAMKFSTAFRALLLVPALALPACGSSKKPAAPDVGAALRSAVDAKAPSFTVVENGERGHHLWPEEQRFYKQNGYQLVWSDGKRPRGQMEGLIGALRAAGDEGLEPADYHVDDLEAARQSLTTNTAVDVDLRATYAYLRYLVYFTAWEENGALQRVPDVYGLDRRHVAAETNTQ